MTESNQSRFIGQPDNTSGIQSENVHLPVNIQLAPKMFAVYSNLVRGQKHESEAYFYRFKSLVCQLEAKDTPSVKNSLISCMSMAVENRRLICPQSNDCPMMHSDTTVSIIDKRKEKNPMADEGLESKGLGIVQKVKKERKKRTPKARSNSAILKEPKISDEDELDFQDEEIEISNLVNASDTYFPETIATELIDKAEGDLDIEATQEEIYLARKAKAMLALITRSYRTNNPVVAVESLINNAIKKIPQIKGKYQ
jgi:hypothetical protein